jgi:uncharacterized membrane protein YebE (DUF533 family)
MSETGECRLGRDVYLALAAIGWADGRLDPDEADAIVRTAVEEGLPLEQIAEIEEAARKPIDMGVIDRTALSKEDRLFVYAVAAWMTQLDGRVAETELAALASLGDSLQIPEQARGQVATIARDIAELPAGDRPARYDLRRIRKILGSRLQLARVIREKKA